MPFHPSGSVEPRALAETVPLGPVVPPTLNAYSSRAATVQALLVSFLNEHGLIGLPGSPSPECASPAAGPQVGDLITLEALAEAHVERVVSRTSSLGQAARILGIDKTTLYRRRKRRESTAATGGADRVAHRLGNGANREDVP